jgi:hypothetical protein
MINDYSLNMINNSMAVSACFTKIMAANKQFLDEETHN